jgi:hypothetical protein
MSPVPTGVPTLSIGWLEELAAAVLDLEARGADAQWARLGTTLDVSARWSGLALDGETLYFTTTQGYLGRIGVDGLNPERTWTYVGGEPSCIAVTETHIYWASNSAKNIGRANIDGSGVEEEWVKTASHILALVVVGDLMYFQRTDNEISRMTLTGELEEAWLGLPGPYELPALASDGTYLFFAWEGESDGQVGSLLGRLHLADIEAELEPLVLSSYTPGSLIAQGDYLYWAGSLGMGRCRIDGSQLQEAYLRTEVGYGGLTSNASRIWWLNPPFVGRFTFP